MHKLPTFKCFKSFLNDNNLKGSFSKSLSKYYKFVKKTFVEKEFVCKYTIEVILRIISRFRRNTMNC
jgi:hypothetical protein